MSTEKAKVLSEQARWVSVLEADGPWESIGNRPVNPEERAARGLTGVGESDRLASGEGHVEDQAPSSS